MTGVLLGQLFPHFRTMQCVIGGTRGYLLKSSFWDLLHIGESLSCPPVRLEHQSVVLVMQATTPERQASGLIMR